jgi:uncharacterized protein YlxP (DUF503 family)
VHLPAPDEAVWIGVLRLSLHVSGSRSLKGKRKVVASVRDHLRARHNLSVAEVGHLDSRDRSILVAALVSNDPKVVRAQLDSIAHSVEGRIGGALVHRSVEVFPVDREASFAEGTDWL